MQLQVDPNTMSRECKPCEPPNNVEIHVYAVANWLARHGRLREAAVMAKQVAVAQRVYVEAPCSAAWGPRACAAWHLDHLWRTVVSEAGDAVRAPFERERERERERRARPRLPLSL